MRACAAAVACTPDPRGPPGWTVPASDDGAGCAGAPARCAVQVALVATEGESLWPRDRHGEWFWQT